MLVYKLRSRKSCKVLDDSIYIFTQMFKTNGTFMSIREDLIEFMIYESNYSSYYIVKWRDPDYCDECQVRNVIKIEHYNCPYVTSTLSIVNKHVAELMNVDGLTSDEIFANMNMLRDYLCKFVDNIHAFADNYVYSTSKSARQ